MDWIELIRLVLSAAGSGGLTYFLTMRKLRRVSNNEAASDDWNRVEEVVGRSTEMVKHLTGEIDAITAKYTRLQQEFGMLQTRNLDLFQKLQILKTRCRCTKDTLALLDTPTA